MPIAICLSTQAEDQAMSPPPSLALVFPLSLRPRFLLVCHMDYGYLCIASDISYTRPSISVHVGFNSQDPPNETDSIDWITSKHRIHRLTVAFVMIWLFCSLWAIGMDASECRIVSSHTYARLRRLLRHSPKVENENSHGQTRRTETRTLGPVLRSWRSGWEQLLQQQPNDLNTPLPSGGMMPAGYIVMQHVERKSRPVKAYRKWVERIPATYLEYLPEQTASSISDDDPNRIGLVRHYQSLMPMAQEARKPVFFLRPAEGAIGAHAQSVSKCYMDFKRMTRTILQRTELGNS